MAKIEIATLGNGCFWCTEAVFQRLNGVESVQSGYSGGHVSNPSYEAVCTGSTGHAEVLQITFDAEILNFKDLLKVFFETHDPTTLNRQGADVGTQYRSAIFYHSEAQRALAAEVIAELSSSQKIASPIVTELVPFEVFFPAEDYHQNYFNQHGSQPYCSMVIGPKVEKFKKLFKDQLKSQ